MKKLTFLTALLVGGMLQTAGCSDSNADSDAAADAQVSASTIPTDIDELTIDLFGGIGVAAGPWETTRFEMAVQPLTYVYQLREPGSILCSIEGSLTPEQEAMLRAKLTAVRYEQFDTDSVTADQPTRSIRFRDGETTTTTYDLFESDWDEQLYPDIDFFYGTAGSDELLSTASALITKCEE
jgi:hypothetical protein